MEIFYNLVQAFYDEYKPLRSFNYNILSKVDGSDVMEYPAMVLESPVQMSDRTGCYEVSANIDFQDLLRVSNRSYVCPDVSVEAELQSIAEMFVQYLENSGVSVVSHSMLFYTDHSDNVVESCRLSVSVQIPKYIPCVDKSDADLWYQGGADVRKEKEGVIPQSW